MVISRDIIEAHGGKIKISSQVEQGTTAKIFFQNETLVESDFESELR